MERDRGRGVGAETNKTTRTVASEVSREWGPGEAALHQGPEPRPLGAFRSHPGGWAAAGRPGGGWSAGSEGRQGGGETSSHTVGGYGGAVDFLSFNFRLNQS